MGLASQLYDVGFLKPLIDALTPHLVWLKVCEPSLCPRPEQTSMDRIWWVHGGLPGPLCAARGHGAKDGECSAATLHPASLGLHRCRPDAFRVRGQEPHPFDVVSAVP